MEEESDSDVTYVPKSEQGVSSDTEFKDISDKENETRRM